MRDEITGGHPLGPDDDRSLDAAAERRRRKRILAATLAVLVVGGGVIALVATHHSSRHDATPPRPSSAPQPPAPSTATSEPLLATTPPSPSPAGPAPTPPAGGLYVCQGKSGGAALCDDRTAKVVSDPGAIAAPENASINTSSGYEYYVDPIFAGTGEVDQISRTPISGGQKQVIIPGSAADPTAQRLLASPVVAPDGKLLAYRETVIGVAQPDPSATALPVPTGPSSSIVVRDLDDLGAAPKLVPASMVSSADTDNGLLGWSPDSTKLFFVSSDDTVKALAVGNDGTATGVSTVFGAAAVTPGCAVARVLLATSGDFFIVASCKSSITVTRIHDGAAEPWGALLNTQGWGVASATVDTSGHLVALSWTAPPYAPLCVGVAGSARIIDGVPTDVQFVARPGCPSAQALPLPAVPPANASS